MAIPFTCPYCGNSITVDDQFAGQSGPCASCGKPITIPSAMPTALGGGAYGPPIQPKLRSSGGMGVVIGVIATVVVGGLCIIGLLAGVLVPVLQQSRMAAKRSQSSNNVKQITLALFNYHDTHRAFPPAYVADSSGKPLYSWRVLILPFMEQDGLYQQFDKSKAWDAPENLAISSAVVQVFQSPGDNTVASNGTNYFAVVGANTMWPGATSINFSEVTDGMSNTLCIIELKGISGSWAAPIDPRIETITPIIGNATGQLNPVFPKGATVGIADGSLRFMSEQTSSETIKRLLDRNGGLPPDDF